MRRRKEKEKERKDENLGDHLFDVGPVEISGRHKLACLVEEFDVGLEFLVRRRSLGLQRRHLKMVSGNLKVQTASVPQSAWDVDETMSHQRDQQKQTKGICSGHGDPDQPRTFSTTSSSTSEKKKREEMRR